MDVLIVDYPGRREGRSYLAGLLIERLRSEGVAVEVVSAADFPASSTIVSSGMAEAYFGEPSVRYEWWDELWSPVRGHAGIPDALKELEKAPAE